MLCITHLPQVAALAEAHFTIVKDTKAKTATTTVTALQGDEVVAELVRMMGASEQDTAAAGACPRAAAGRLMRVARGRLMDFERLRVGCSQFPDCPAGVRRATL